MDLNIRNFPDELAQWLKLESVKRGVAMRELVIELLSSGRVVTLPTKPELKRVGSTPSIATKKTPVEIPVVRSVEQPTDAKESCEHGRPKSSICLQCMGR